MGAAKVPEMHTGVILIVRGDNLGRLPIACTGRFTSPGRRAPSEVDNCLRGPELKGRLLAALGGRGEIPDLDLPVGSGAGEMLSVRMPIYRITGFVMSGDPHDRRIDLSVVPQLNGTAVSGSREHEAIIGRPAHVANGVRVAVVQVGTAASADGGGHAQVPQADGRIVTAGQQPGGEIRIEGQAVNLAGVALEATELQARTVEIIDNNAAIGYGGGDNILIGAM